MINKIIVDGENVELTDKSQVPFRHTFSQANTHIVRYGIDNTDEVCAYAFKDCTELTSITIPDSVTSIGFCVFVYCDDITIKGVPGSVAEDYARTNCIKFETII